MNIETAGVRYYDLVFTQIALWYCSCLHLHPSQHRKCNAPGTFHKYISHVFCRNIIHHLHLYLNKALHLSHPLPDDTKGADVTEITQFMIEMETISAPSITLYHHNIPKALGRLTGVLCLSMCTGSKFALHCCYRCDRTGFACQLSPRLLGLSS